MFLIAKIYGGYISLNDNTDWAVNSSTDGYNQDVGMDIVGWLQCDV